MDDNIKKELQSAAFERLINHLRERKDVQNLDLMNLNLLLIFIYEIFLLYFKFLLIITCNFIFFLAQ